MSHKRTLNALHRQLLAEQSENAAATYTINWAGFLDTDTISSSTWTTESGGLTIAGESNTTKITSARLSGSIGRHRAINQVVTTNGDTFERYINVRIRDNSAELTWDYGFIN